MHSHSRRMSLREVSIYFPPFQNKGRRECRAPDAPRGLVCNGSVRSAHEHTGHTGITRHSPRNGFNGYFVISPVLRAFWPPSPALLLADLTPASGCQDHTTSHVRINTVRYRRIRVHRIPSRGRDDRDSPLCWDGTAANIAVICTSEKQNIFSQWAGQNGQISAWGAR